MSKFQFEKLVIIFHTNESQSPGSGKQVLSEHDSIIMVHKIIVSKTLLNSIFPSQ